MVAKGTWRQREFYLGTTPRQRGSSKPAGGPTVFGQACRSAAHDYSVRHNDTVLQVTVAEIGDTGLDDGTVIDRAIKSLSQGGEAKDNIPQRGDSAYRRQVSLAWSDGSRSEVAVFDYNGRLYQKEAKALPGKTDNSADILRFEQSLVLTDGAVVGITLFFPTLRDSGVLATNAATARAIMRIGFLPAR
jgi:hypothetical protein